MRNAHTLDLGTDLESIRTGAPVAVPACAFAEEVLGADVTETTPSQENAQ